MASRLATFSQDNRKRSTVKSKSQSNHIFSVSTLKSEDVTSKSEGAQTCDIRGRWCDVSRRKADRFRPIKSYQDRSRRFVDCFDLSKSICLDVDAQGRQFSSTLIFSIHSICLGHMSQKAGESGRTWENHRITGTTQLHGLDRKRLGCTLIQTQHEIVIISASLSIYAVSGDMYMSGIYEKSLCVCVRVQLWANQLNCRHAQ